MLVCSWLAWLLLFVLMLDHSNQGRICSTSHQCLTELIVVWFLVPVISISVGGCLVSSTCRQYLSWCLIFGTCHQCLTEVTVWFPVPVISVWMIAFWFPVPIISIWIDCCLISSTCHQYLNWLLFDFQRLSSVFELIVVWFPAPVISIWIDCCLISSTCHQYLNWLLFDFQRLSSIFELIVVWFPAPVISIWIGCCLISSVCHQPPSPSPCCPSRAIPATRTSWLSLDSRSVWTGTLPGPLDPMLQIKPHSCMKIIFWINHPGGLLSKRFNIRFLFWAHLLVNKRGKNLKVPLRHKRKCDQVPFRQ